MYTPIAILFTCVSCLLVGAPDPGMAGHPFTVVGWNVDSGDADAHLVALRLAEMDGVHLWGLSEVRDTRWAELLEGGAEGDEPGEFVGVLSPTRGSGRSLILCDTGRFQLLGYFELNWDEQPWRTADMVLRPALVARLRHHATGQEFFFMVNRLHPQWAARQAVMLTEWAVRQSIPVIAVGSYYFQYGVGPQPVHCDGRKGLSFMVQSGVFDWLKPANLVKTYDTELNTIEDFIFLANAAGKLTGQAHVVVEPGDFPDTATTSDHRPVRATFTVAGPRPERALRRRILERVLRIQAQVDELEALVRQLPH